MRATIIQFQPRACKPENIEAVRAILAAAVREDAPDLVSLPEMWTCLGGDRAAKFAAGENLPSDSRLSATDSAYRFLSEMALQHRITLHGGSIGELDGTRLYNTSLVFDPTGTELARYRKIHLFDVVTPGGQGYRESATYAPGESIVTCSTPCGELGLAICYDLRFPELFLALRRAGARITMVPAAFTKETGRAHWEVLLRARAIETQSWVIAAATCGTHFDAHGQPRVTHGHSMVIDPWGTIRAQLADEAGYATVELDPELTVRTRSQMPLFVYRPLA